MDILIISGFLGAGKTTFIRELAKRTRREIAILENEYAPEGIDGKILKDEMGTEKVNIWEMAEGCICCSMKGDFAGSVLTIANTVDPDCLVIEPTGIGMLSNIICTLRQIEYERISLLAPVTIVDGKSCQRFLHEFPELYKDQLSSAHTILLSKMEQAEAGERARLYEYLRQWNPTADILTEHYTSLEPSWWEALLQKRYDGKPVKRPELEKLPDSFSLNQISIDSPERLILLLEDIIHGRYGNIFRAKGYLNAPHETLRFDVADGRYSVTGADSVSEGKAVFIGDDIQRQKLRRIFCRKSPKIRIHRGTL